ncbi:hypothetical protein EDB84DRAFT_1492759 [Lactarius hengduanensis]|nr:hypothetical protein EDB84DRAFT_1492759 [Lactarius hengduanensis]
MPTLCTFDVSQSTLNFPRPFVDRPRLAHGLRELDIGNNADIRVTSRLQNITTTSADCQITPWADTVLYSAAADVIALAPGDLDFLTGEHTRDLWQDPNDPASVRIDFERPFATGSKGRRFFNCIRPRTGTASWRTRSFYAARACWIAYPEDHEHIFSKSINTMDETPPVFIALNYLDIDCRTNLRVNAYVESVSTTGLIWHIDSWDNTTLYSAGATIIAFN